MARLSGVEGLTARRMFGEAGISLDGRPIGSICDGRLFLKATPAGEALLDEPELLPPYPGAKAHLAVPDAVIDEPEKIEELIRATAEGLPPARARSRAARKPGP
jgi:TfoX/Sxy family transcriptional regulator of competence genes